MIRCMKTSFRANKQTIDQLFECNRISGEVWNRCLELAKETHLKTGKWITKSELQKGTKGIFPIHSQSVQAVCHKYLFARMRQRRQEKQDIKINIHTNRRNISTQNGQTTASKCLRTVKSNYLWGILKAKDKPLYLFR